MTFIGIESLSTGGDTTPSCVGEEETLISALHQSQVVTAEDNRRGIGLRRIIAGNRIRRWERKRTIEEEEIQEDSECAW